MKQVGRSLRKHVVFIVFVFLVCLAGWIYFSTKAPGLSIKSYDECIAAGNPVLESFPAQCRTQDGRIFLQPLSVPSLPPKKVQITGKIVCLPHKGKGPQTMECAYGLQSEKDDKYYGLSYKDPNAIKTAALPTGAVVTIEGTLREQPESKYAIVGVIDVTAIQK